MSPRSPGSLGISIRASRGSFPNGRPAARLSGFHGRISPENSASPAIGRSLLARYRELADTRSQTNSQVWIFPLTDVGGVAKMIRFP